MEDLTIQEQETSPTSGLAERETALRIAAWDRCGVEPRHARRDTRRWEHFKWSEYYGFAQSAVEDCGIVVLLGTRGNGKTQLAVELLRRSHRDRPIDNINSPFPPNLGLYVRAREIGIYLRQAYGPTATLTEAQAIARFVLPPLLVIDECQELRSSEAEQRTFTLVLDCRYGQMRPTVLIANCDKEGFVRLVGSSVADRVKEGGGYLTFNWKSFRGD